MKIVKVQFLGREYEIRCEDHEESKIINLQERLNNRVKHLSNLKNNFNDTHKLLLASLYLEDQVDELINKQKKLINIIEDQKKDLLKHSNDDFIDIKKNINSISEKISRITKKISKENNE